MPCIGMIQWKHHQNHCGATFLSTKPALFTGSFHDSDTALLAQVMQPSNSSMSFGELPSKNALVAQVLGTFLAPISSLAVVLNQILEQKGGAPAEEAPAEA